MPIPPYLVLEDDERRDKWFWTAMFEIAPEFADIKATKDNSKKWAAVKLSISSVKSGNLHPTYQGVLTDLSKGQNPGTSRTIVALVVGRYAEGDLRSNCPALEEAYRKAGFTVQGCLYPGTAVAKANVANDKVDEEKRSWIT
jgi:hypothetical protein